MLTAPNILPYKFESNFEKGSFRFKKGDITISGILKYEEILECYSTTIYETKDQFYGMNLSTEHFEKFINSPIQEVINAIPMLGNDKGLIFVNFENFFGHFSKEDFESIIEGLTYLTKVYIEKKNKLN